jgi:hypothetical protein
VRTLSSQATDGYFKEYEQCMGTYRFTYQTIWQAGSVFTVASAAVIGIAAAGGGGVDPAALLIAPLPFLFWWLGVFRPMNRYGEVHSKRCARLEEILSARIPELEMNHFRKFDSMRKRFTFKERVMTRLVFKEPRVHEVVNVVGCLLILYEIILLCITLF